MRVLDAVVAPFFGLVMVSFGVGVGVGVGAGATVGLGVGDGCGVDDGATAATVTAVVDESDVTVEPLVVTVAADAELLVFAVSDDPQLVRTQTPISVRITTSRRIRIHFL